MEKENQKIRFDWEPVYKNVLILVILCMPFFIKDVYKFRHFANDNNV